MPHRTYCGGMGADVLGGFIARAEGFGDTSISAIVPFVKRDAFELNAGAGLSIPTGSLSKIDEILTPMDIRLL